MHGKPQVEIEDIPFIAFIDKGLLDKPIQHRRFIRYRNYQLPQKCRFNILVFEKVVLSVQRV